MQGTGSAGKKRLRLFLRWFFRIAVLLLVFYVLRYRTEWDEFGAAFAGVSWFFVFLAILANLASIMLKAASWKVIFDFTFGFRGRWRDLTSAIMIGFLVNALVPARIGELARAYVITRRQAIRGHFLSRSTAFGTVVLERVFDGVAMALLVLFGITRLNLPAWADRGAIAILIIAAAFGAAVIFLEAKREKLRKGAEAAKAATQENHPWWRKQLTRLHGVVARFSEGQQVLRNPLRIVVVFCTTSLSWTSQLVAVYLSVRAFHLVNPSGNSIGMSGALLLLILINIAGALPATPGNVGIFQLATVIPLSVTFGIPESTALAFSIGLQAIEGSIGLGLGSLFLLREGLSFKEVRSESLRDREEIEEKGEEIQEEIEEEIAGEIKEEAGKREK